MVAIASRARSSFAIAAAAATLLGAASLTPKPRSECDVLASVADQADDEMKLTARLAFRQMPVGFRSNHVVVSITAPEGRPQVRPPVSVAIAIDRSKSMSGLPLEHAKAAAARLVAQLDASDAFSIVTYSNGDDTLIPMTHATPAAKATAAEAIQRIEIDNGTCISCGIMRASAELARTPLDRGIRRIVLISDGRPLIGLRDPDDLVQLAAETAAKGVSISTVGVGLDFDETTMIRMAEVGRGNYHFVEDTGRLDAAFDREVAGLAATIATNVKLELVAADRVHIEEVLGHEKTTVGNTVYIPVPDLRAGETRTFVVRVSHDRHERCPFRFVTASLAWHRAADDVQRRALAVADAMVIDGRAEMGGHDGEASATVERALAGRFLALLTNHLDGSARSGTAAANRAVEDYLRARAIVDAEARRSIEVELARAADLLDGAASTGDMPRAVKLSREISRGLLR